MKKYLFLMLWACISCVQGMVIPANNRVPWNKAGYSPPAAVPHLKVNIMDFGAFADGIRDDKRAVEQAIAALGGRYGIVLFPAGTYLLDSSINLPDSVIIRGEGSNTTFIKINSTGNCFEIYGKSTNSFTRIISGYTKESDRIVVKNPQLFEAGDFVELRQDNGSWDINPTSWTQKVVGQITRISSIVRDTLFLDDILRIDYDAALRPEIQKIIPRSQVCIEYLNIERINSSKEATGFNIHFNYAVNCRVKGIESNKSQGSHCKVSLSSHIEITGSYFHDAFMYDGAGTKGYGVTVDFHSGLCLVSNNIFRHLRHAMMTKDGANGNVFAYNYSMDVYRNGPGEFPKDFAGDISLHGHYSYANLYEGNIISNLIVDEYRGPSGPYNTFFRNRIQNYGLFLVSNLTSHSNIVGNEITGKFLKKFYILYGKNNFEYGNNVHGDISPAGTTFLNDKSYYLHSKPHFWNIPDSWPSIGMGNRFNSGTIPAKNRYERKIYTVCPDDRLNDNITGFGTVKLDVFPNPAKDFIVLKINAGLPTNALVTFTDASGSPVKNCCFDLLQKGVNQKNFDISDMARGIYFVKVTTENGIGMQKIILK